MKNRIKSIVGLTAFIGATLLGTGCASQHTAENDPKTALRATAAYSLGQTAQASGDETAAIKHYQEALKLDPTQPASLKQLATIYTNRESYGQAIPIWKRYVAAIGGTAEAYNDLGYCYDLSGFADPAEAAYLHGVDADPVNVRVRTNYGLFLARQGRTNEALLQLRAAMAPADAHYNIAVVLESQGKVRAARNEFQKALDFEPEMDEARMKLAEIE